MAYSAYCVFATLLSPLAAHYVFRSVVQAAVLKVNAHPLCALVHTRSASCERLPSYSWAHPALLPLPARSRGMRSRRTAIICAGRLDWASQRSAPSLWLQHRCHVSAPLPCLALPCLALPSAVPTAQQAACGTAQYFVLVVEKHGFPNLNTFKNIWKALWHKDPVAGQALLRYSLSARARSHAPHISCCFEHVLHCDEPCAVRASTPAVLVDAH